MRWVSQADRSCNASLRYFRCTQAIKQSNAYRVNMQNELKKITNNPLLTYKPRKKHFDRILVINSSQQSKARRSAFINTHRNDLIHFFNSKSQTNMLYVVNLFQINQFVPTHELIKHLQLVLDQKTLWKQAKTKESAQHSSKLHAYNSMLFPFNLNEWKRVTSQSFPNLNRINKHQMQQSYLYLQSCNLYLIKYSRNPQFVYLDLRDFDQFLSKFNFIRFFWQYNHFNEYQARKYSQRLIKSIKWRTRQSQQYLLMVIRAYGWERFMLHLQDFCICYETLHPNQARNYLQSAYNQQNQ